MAKAKKKSSKKQSGFFSKFFDIITAIVIIGIISGAVYLYFNLEDDKPELKKAKGDIDKLYPDKNEKKAAKIVQEKDASNDDFDESADHEEMERIDSDIIHGEDEFADQFEEEMSSNFNSEDVGREEFYTSVDKWAKKYTGYNFKLGADPDKVKAADNSNLICAIWKNAAKDSGMYFKGYINTADILKNSKKIDHADLRNGDIVVLQDKTMGMVINYNGPVDFKLIFASASKGSVLISDYETIVNYWLKPDNFFGYYRPNKEILK
jgi:hypothetical protein